MKLVIDIPNYDYEYITNGCIVPIKFDNHIYEAIRNGTPLPKGHGRIIDESKITSIYYHEETAKQGAITAKAIFIDGTDAPTIVEAANKSEV